MKRSPGDLDPAEALIRWGLTVVFFLGNLAGRYWRLVMVVLVTLIVGFWWSFHVAWTALFFGSVWLILRNGTKHPRHGWWSHPRLAQALIEAGILHGPVEQAPLRYVGKVAFTDHGATVVVALAQARSINEVLNRRDQLAAALGVPLARLEVFQHEDDSANLIRIHVTHGRLKESRSTVATAERTDWAQPVRIGVNSRGEPVWYSTFEHNGLVAGTPGSGKTSLTRIPLSHFLLDPDADAFILDGKGSLKDYGECRDLCRTYIAGTDDNAVSDTLAMLDRVLTEVRWRNAQGGEYPGVLVLLEELQDVRASATRDQRDELDAILGRIVRMGRAVGVHVIVATQRPTADDLPPGVRNLLSQRIALMLRNGADAALVLGTTPGVPLPTRRGQALFTDGGPITPMTPDRLTNEDWSRVCERAARLRKPGGWGGHPGAAPELPAEASITPALDPLLAAVVAVLSEADPRGLPASELHARLPEWTHEICPDGHSLGVKLAKHPAQVERAHIGSARGWRLHARAGAR
jgi:hypothetical protein